MTNNQLAENSVIQLLNSVKLARDNAERADNRVDHSFYYALTIALGELQERRKADSEPYGFTDGDRRGMIYEPQYADRLNEPLPVYRHAQPAPVVPEEKPIPNTLSMYAVDAVAAIAEVKGWNACRAAMLQENAKSAGVSNNCRSSENVQVMQDHQIRELVNQLRDIAVKYHAAGQLREQIARVIRAAMLQAGNSPVIPDGWTGNDKANAALMMLDRIETVDPVDDDRIDGIKRIVRELAAAPHDTPALNSVQSVDSVADRWIPVSERMPPSRHEVLVGRWWGEKPRWCCKWATYIPGHPDSQSSGWLIPGASWTPTHWMPLPAAPQEVK